MLSGDVMPVSIGHSKVLIPNFEKGDGLVTVVVNCAICGVGQETILVATTNREAFEETLRTGKLVLWSRSRNKRWAKGEESGNTYSVEQILIDCDGDALIYNVTPDKPDTVMCHTGSVSCFSRTILDNPVYEDQQSPRPKFSKDELLHTELLEVDRTIVDWC
jgi:phosphoribosyl-AMP cyclohydrolase